jgi:hypothetical protein
VLPTTDAPFILVVVVAANRHQRQTYMNKMPLTQAVTAQPIHADQLSAQVHEREHIA